MRTLRGLLHHSVLKEMTRKTAIPAAFVHDTPATGEVHFIHFRGMGAQIRRSPVSLSEYYGSPPPRCLLPSGRQHTLPSRRNRSSCRLAHFSEPPRFCDPAPSRHEEIGCDSMMAILGGHPFPAERVPRGPSFAWKWLGAAAPLPGKLQNLQPLSSMLRAARLCPSNSQRKKQ